MKKIKVLLLGFDTVPESDTIDFITLTEEDLSYLSPVEFVSFVPRLLRKIDLAVVNDNKFIGLKVSTSIQFVEGKKIPCIGITDSNGLASRVNNFGTLEECVDYINSVYSKFII